MSLPSLETLAQRRAHLSAEIARQRGALAAAYRNLEKPIHYAEYGLRGFGFFRQNQWIFVAVPAVVSIASTLLGFRKGKAPKREPSQRQSSEARPKGFVGHAMKWGGHGWRLFKFYRRARRFLS